MDRKTVMNNIIIILVAGVLAGLSYLITTETSLAQGIQYRLFAFVAPALGIILGKYKGGFAAAIAEGVWVLVTFYGLGLTYALSIATPFALIGNFFQAYIPGLVVEKYGDDIRSKLTVKNAGLIIAGSIAGFAVLCLWFGIFFHLLDVAPFEIIIKTLIYSDFLPILIGTVPFVWIVMYLIKRKKAIIPVK